MPVSPARIAAYEILLRVERDRAFSSALLPRYESELGEKDAALCHQIVLGVLRRKLYLDKRIRNVAGSKKIDVEVLTALRIGVYQLLELDRVPDHSAVNDSVGLVQRAKKTSAKGFVNAILRRIAAEPESPNAGDDLEEIAVELSHPRWLLERWFTQFGRERAMAVAEANNRPSRIAFRLTADETELGLLSSEPSTIVDGSYTVGRISTRLRELAEQGKIYFQDEASQVVAGMVLIPDSGRFLDVCAAPGGKTSLIALRNPNASVVAGDLYHARVEFLRANCVRQGITQVQIAQYNAEASLPFAEDYFDAILVDAPCSGTGTIGSNPEIRYVLRPEDIEELSRKQLTILRNASKLVKSGGRLYYSTCSLEREENENVVNAFLSESNHFVATADRIDSRFRTPEGFGRTFPDRDRTDGFFFAELVRR